MATKKPPALFELVFSGGGVYPEKIPINKVADALSAIRRLTAGEVLGDEDEEEDDGDGAVRLVDVTRTSSAVFRFVSPSPKKAIQRLKTTGKVLGNPADVGENEFVLRPVKDLSAIADSLGCSVILRMAGGRQDVLAKIEHDSYALVSRSLLVTGDTRITGSVQRVGGATEMRCALRVAFQSRLLYCKVEDQQLARRLGDLLYQRVIAYGTARWMKGSMRIYSFAVKDVSKPKSGSITDHLNAIWEAGMNEWEKVENPDAHLSEIRGD